MAARGVSWRRPRRSGGGVSLCLAFALSLLCGRPAAAQEPRPVSLSAASFEGAEGVELTFAWRFRSGDDPAWAEPGLDDADWVPVRPAMAGERPPGGWSGVGWFRRHLRLAPDVRGREVSLRIASPGEATVFLNGERLSREGSSAAALETAFPRREAWLARLPDGETAVLAVRYVMPVDAARRPPPEGIGFLLTLDRPGVRPAATTPWRIGLEGAAVSVPLFVALLHLALFGFDRRARENLFYAGQMAISAVLILREFRASLVPGELERELLDRWGSGLPALASLFGLLTYYAVRTRPFPRSARPLLSAGVVLSGAAYVWAPAAEHGWIVYFAAVVLEVVRLERSGRVVPREGMGFYLAGMAVFGVAIALQVMVIWGWIESVAGLRTVFVLGALGSAVGMSLFLARTLGQTRLLEAENDRKGQELERARELQLSMLPRELPSAPGLDVAAVTAPAAEVGGDYYDLRRDGEGLLVAFGDATGHGLSSGLVVTAVKALFVSLPVDGALPHLLAACDRALREMRLRKLHMCLSLARITRDEAVLASAAMPPALVHRAASDVVEELGAGGLPLGSRLGPAWEERRTRLVPGDTLLFASDGFPELVGADERVLGFPGAAEAFRLAARAADARGVVARLQESAAAWRGARAQDDDMTFVVFRVLR